MNWKSNVWPKINVLVAVLAVIGMFVIYFLTVGAESKSLEVTVLPASSLISESVRKDENLEVTYKGRKLQNLYIFSIRFRNSGAKPITPDDFIEPIKVTFSPNNEIISSTVLYKNPDNISVTIAAADNVATFSKFLMNPNDQIVIQIKSIVKDFEKTNIDITARITGVKKIDIFSFTETGSTTHVIIFLVCLSLGTILVIVSGISLYGHFTKKDK
jgi:hypothetical protein